MAVVFVIAGATKLLDARYVVGHCELWGFPRWIPYTTGAIELLCGVLLLFPATRFYGATPMVCMMALGLLSRWETGESVPAVLAVVLAVMCATVAWKHRPRRFKKRAGLDDKVEETD